MIESTISVVDSKSLLGLFGPRDQYLRAIRGALGVSISARDGEIRIEGDEAAVAKATEVLVHLKGLYESRGSLEMDDVSRILSQTTGGALGSDSKRIEVFNPTCKIKPRTAGQARYVEAIENYDLVLSIGPAGSGKTYLAVAMAVAALREGRVRRIVLVRPAVEAGESLGFLPGDLQAKINPYLRPLLDALHEMIDYELMRRYLDQDVIEVAPLAYMRGRTLNDAFIILDEAQNTTVAQMKMFLTRMGYGSKIVVSGDTTQVDLPSHTRSGLIDATDRLRHISGIAQVRLTNSDIVRNPLVTQIVGAYEEGTKKRH